MHPEPYEMCAEAGSTVGRASAEDLYLSGLISGITMDGDESCHPLTVQYDVAS